MYCNKNLVPLTVDTFNNAVKGGNLAVLFCQSSCKLCDLVVAEIDKAIDLSEESDMVKFYSVDCIHNLHLAYKYNVRSLPAILFFKNGEVVDSLIGASSKEKVLRKVDNIYPGF